MVLDLGVEAQQVQQAVAGYVREAVHVNTGAQHRRHLRHVDVRAAQQLLADGTPALRQREADGLVSVVAKQEAAREREPVRVDAVARHADDRVAGPDGGAGDGAAPSSSTPTHVAEMSNA